MWIEKIELLNFKAYQKQVFTFPKPENGQNLILIGGKNGFGKTTLLEALYLCLYNKDAMSHLGRAGLKNDRYNKFLQSALHGKTLVASSDKMSVSVRFMEKENYGFEITRLWYFDSKGNFLEDELRLNEIKDGIEKSYDKDELDDILEIYAVPAHLAPFFFFDGEEVKKLADNDREGTIKQGMESLMGVVLLKNLKKRLTDYQYNRRPNGKNISKAELNVKHNALNVKKDELEKIENTWKSAEEEKNKNTERRDYLQNQLKNLGMGNENVKNVADILEEIAKEKSSLSSIEKQLEQFLAGSFPFYLIDNNLKESLKEQLNQEEISLEWEARKLELEPRKKKFSKAFFETESFKELKNNLSESAIEKLHNCIDNAWEMLYSPAPIGYTDKILHNHLETKQRQKLMSFFSSQKISATQIKDLIKQKDDLLQKLKTLESKQNKIESIDNDGLLDKIHNELKSVQIALDESTSKSDDLNREKRGLKSEIHNEEATYEKQYSDHKRSEPEKSKAEKSEKVVSLIQDLLPRLFSLKIQEVSQSVGDYYKQFAHKKQIDRIDIQEDGSYRLFSEDNKEITFDRSAGENEIFVTALFAGLAKVSNYEIPLVVDTPLARLDKDHRKNLLDYWCSDSNRQVILLSQDTEVDEKVIEDLKPHISKTYLLKSIPISDGIYETTARENTYFGERL